MKREQSRAGSRFAECEKSRLKAKILITLALLLTAVTGAWAQSSNASELNVPDSWQNGSSTITADDLPGFVAVTIDQAKAWAGAPKTGGAILIYGFNGSNLLYVDFQNGVYNDEYNLALMRSNLYTIKNAGAKIYYTSDAIEVTPGSSANTWTFSMPGSDVVLTPIYAKAAAFATTGTEPEVKTLLPEAAEGVIAGTDASLIAEGTGIVAFAGESTEVTQGTLMYAIGTSATEAPALTAFSATVPTAKDYDDATTLYVWYYIQGADAPDGVAATLDNTFDDTEPACLTATVLTNKFDITLKAANANTIEAGNATVTVGGTAATVTDGKLQGVKMGSEVKMTAKQGYKFRKVEVKKTKTKLTIGDITLDVTGCSTWQQVADKNSTLISIFNNMVCNASTSKNLKKGDSYVRPDDPVDPTATDYQFVEGHG